MAASSSSAVTLRIVQITDVYKLDNFPSLRTLINDKRQQLEELRGGQENARLISVLTGDFLAPYLLSALDQGRGMIRMLNECPIDLLTFGKYVRTLSFIFFFLSLVVQNSDIELPQSRR